jgi:hypothetical protein
MSPFTPAEKQRRYRNRRDSLALSEQSGTPNVEPFMNINDFLESIDFDRQLFDEILESEGEESEAYTEEKNEEWQKAYDEAFEEAYDEVMQKAINNESFDPDEDDDGEIKETAKDTAREIADEALKEWEASIDDYHGNCVEYPLSMLIGAYRQAQTLN